MNIESLKILIDHAATHTPPKAILDYCGQYYSPYYYALFQLAMSKPSFCVELGVETGRGSFAMLLGGARVVGIDEHNHDSEARLKDERQFTLIKASSTPVPRILVDMHAKIDILHIDTEHSFAQAREEFKAYKGMLSDGAIVCFDDTNAMEGEVLKFVESLPYEHIRDDRLHPESGYAMMIYRKDVT